MPRLNRQTVFITAGGVGLLLAARALVRWWREYDLRDKVVLVTGGSRGLGLVLSRQLLHQGARVAICARDEPELGRARSDLGRNDARVLTVPCDITDWGQVHETVHSLFPGWTADMLGLANTLLLPAPGGIGTARLPGKHSSSALSPSWLTTLSDRAAQRNNENI